MAEDFRDDRCVHCGHDVTKHSPNIGCWKCPVERRCYSPERAKAVLQSVKVEVVAEKQLSAKESSGSIVLVRTRSTVRRRRRGFIDWLIHW